MLTSNILEESVKDLHGKDPFRTMTWKSSNNPSNKLVSTFWQIETNFRKFKFIEYLKLRNFLFDLDPLLLRCLCDAPSVLSDNLYIDLLKAKSVIGLTPILMERLNILMRMENKTEWSKNLFFTYDNVLKFRISEIRSAIRPTAKFSGYVRNISAIGTKKALPVRPDPETSEWNDVVQIDFLRFLTVGEFTTGTPGDNVLILKIDPVRSKRLNTNIVCNDL
jgi:hypothetical protein